VCSGLSVQFSTNTEAELNGASSCAISASPSSIVTRWMHYSSVVSFFTNTEAKFYCASSCANTRNARCNFVQRTSRVPCPVSNRNS
jgi:hypothetical protein